MERYVYIVSSIGIRILIIGSYHTTSVAKNGHGVIFNVYAISVSGNRDNDVLLGHVEEGLANFDLQGQGNMLFLSHGPLS
jgi:hypothetical protein